MPSMSRLNGAVMQMRGQQHVLDTMERGGFDASHQNILCDLTSATFCQTVNLHTDKYPWLTSLQKVF